MNQIIRVVIINPFVLAQWDSHVLIDPFLASNCSLVKPPRPSFGTLLLDKQDSCQLSSDKNAVNKEVLSLKLKDFSLQFEKSVT